MPSGAVYRRGSFRTALSRRKTRAAQPKPTRGETSSALKTFVTRAQLRRVMAVFVPTLLFCLVTQYLGLYVASFLLIAGFMRLVGKIAVWKSLLTALVFTAIMFVTFDIVFDVIMPKGPLEAALGY